MTTPVVVLAALFAGQGPADLSADGRLAGTVTVRAEAETVRVVLKRLSEDIGVRLAASGALEEELIILLAKDRPAHEVLSVIAEHFDWTWKKEDDGYRIYQTTASKKEERKQLEELILKPYLDLQKKAKKQLKETEKADREAVEKEIAALTERYNAALQAGDWERWTDLSRQMLWQQGLVSHWSRFVNEVFVGLSRERLLELDRRSRLVFAYDPTPSQHRLNVSSDALRTLIEEAAREREKRWREIEERTGRTPTDPSSQPLAADDVANVRVEFRLSPGRRGHVDYPATAWVTLLGRDGKVVATGGGLNFASQWGGRRIAGWKEGEEPPVREKNRLDEETPLTEGLKKVLERNERGRLALPLARRKAFFEKGSSVDPRSGLGALLCEVAGAANVSLVCDLYDVHYWAASAVTVQDTAPGALLDAVSNAMRAAWKLDRGWVKVRTVEWPLARYESVPQPLLFSTRDLFLGQVGLTFDQMASLAAKLNDYQASSPILEHTLGILLWPAWSEAGLYMLRLWNALGPVQRKVLLEGGQLEYGRLGPAAEARFGDVVYRSRTTANAAGGPVRGDPDQKEEFEWAQATWTAREQGDDSEITQLLPSGPLAQSTIELRFVKREGLFEKPNGRHPAAYLNLMNAQDRWRSEERRATLFEREWKPAIVGKYMFTFRLRLGLVTGEIVRSATSDPSVPFRPYASLPGALRQKIEYRPPPPGGVP